MPNFRLSAGFALLLATAACGGSDAPDTGAQAPMTGMPMAEMPMGPSVRIVQPADGATVGPNVNVEFAVSNFRIAPSGTMDPGTGHHHLFVDTDVTPMGQPIPAGVQGIVHMGMAQTSHMLEGLAPGRHRLIAVVADGMHVPVTPAMMDTITIVVGP